MQTLKLTERDTKPTVLRVTNAGDAVSIDGYSITLKIAYSEPLQREATITDAANGLAEIRWQDTDLVVGTHTAQLLIASPVGEETTEDFTLYIKARI